MSTGLLSEDQCRAREVRRKTRTPGQAPKKSQASVGADDEFEAMTSSSSLSVSSSAAVKTENPLELVSEETREIIHKLVYYQDLYELPGPEDIERVSVRIVLLLLIAGLGLRRYSAWLINNRGCVSAESED